MPELVQLAYDCVLAVTKRPGKGCFVPEPFRAVVERTEAWLAHPTVLCRDYQTLPENHQGMIYVVMIRLMLRRLSKNRRIRKHKTT